MKEKIEELRKILESKIDESSDLGKLNEFKINYLGKSGPISELTGSLRDLDVEKKKEYGKLITDFKNDIFNKYESLKSKYELEELNKKLENEKVDISMPGMDIPSGSPSIVEKVIDDATDFFISLGYDVYEGPEIELDKYNFKDEEILLRSQTSPVQVRVMLDGKGETPIRMICPGKTYRREDINATHEQEFTQIEGLVIDKKISLSDLKGTFDAFVKHTFGENVEARFRPSYYPFTEPSVEMDMSCICGYDPDIWQGFAFGMAAERIGMLKYNMSDMRTIHENDLRETKNFDRKEVK